MPTPPDEAASLHEEDTSVAMSPLPTLDLTLAEMASLTAGADVWHLPAIPRIGLHALRMSDGPSGVRGSRIGTRRSLSFPCGLAVGATWDTELVVRYGAALASEARSKGVHLLLGPTVGVIRTPLGGRGFESFAEDPYLSACLTVAHIRAVQAGGVGCCVKHFACNDQEHERMTISAEVDERTLREVHLRPFEAAVTEAGTWAVMSAYNRVNGVHCGESSVLLGQILKDEWGFDGVVVSDWFGTHSTVEAAIAGLDIEMPGPARFLGAHLAGAVRAGAVAEEVVEGQAERILRLARRTGALGGTAHPEELEQDAPARRAVARELAAAATVLLCNNGVLPLDSGAARRVALIGPNAYRLEGRGGGSSDVTPFTDAPLLDELRARLGDTEVVYEEGCRLERGVPPMDARLLTGGMHLEYFTNTDLVGTPAAEETLWATQFVALGDPYPGVPLADSSTRATATFEPDQSGVWQLGLANTGSARLLLDGDVVIDNSLPERGSSFFGAGSTTVTAEVPLDAGRAYELTVELTGATRVPLVGFEIFGARPPLDGALERAVVAARDADVAVVVVGSNSHWDTEGADRAHLRLLGDQDELARRVIDANPRTVVVVNAGAPVEMPWADDAAAVLVVWYPGEEGSTALADVLTGRTDPGGRLPVTFPKRLEDSATHGWYPGVDGKVTYGEGVFVGYRHFDATGTEPAFCFGHGLSYTSFEVGEPTVNGAGTALTVSVPVTNTGTRRGSEVVQLYVAPPAGEAERPPKQLAGFAKATLDPGTASTLTITIDERAFARWSSETHAWTVDPGAYELLVGTSSRQVHHRLPVALA